jgi:hypothetical protein
MKKRTTPIAVPPDTKRWPARLADAELAHLESVLAVAGRRSVATAVRGLDLAYWSARLAAVEAQHDLLTSQTKRIEALSRLLVGLDPTVEIMAELGTAPAQVAA